MKAARILLLCGALAAACCLWAQEPGAKPGTVQFCAVDVFVDTGSQPLAAYQLEFRAITGTVRIVSIEGGEHAAFREAPYYDPAAIQHERAILAAFNTAPAGQLPVGRTRLATLHLQVSGEVTPTYSAILQTAAGSDGRPIRAQITATPRNTR